MTHHSRSCPASALTLGTCLPGKYTLRYTVYNAAGLQSSAYLHLLVEQLSLNRFSYAFTPSNSSDLAAVTQLAGELRVNASLASVLAAQQLPAFGVDASSIRSVTVDSVSVIPGPDNNGTATYLISIDLTAVLVRGPAAMLPMSSSFYEQEAALLSRSHWRPISSN